MKALQYVYTSWKNGDLPNKGFMIYSKSPGITDGECEDIKFVMQYTVPKEMIPNPTPEEIVDSFPYSFAYFVLSSSRACIAQSTYLGKDYSGRYGNYLIHALVIDMDELDTYPAELFAEDFIKTVMMDDELNAIPPIPPLDALDIEECGNVINDEQVMEFLFDKEDEFAYLVSAMLEAQRTGVPFYLNDTRENLVLWMAAIQKMLPLHIAKKITFSTYVGNPDKFRLDSTKVKGLTLCCYGVRPDANYFSYLSGAKSSQQVVMDFVDGNMTENINILNFAKSMASSYALGMDDIHEYGQFLERVGYSKFDLNLESAYFAYDLYYTDNLGEGKEREERISKILAFGKTYCNQEINSELGAKILNKMQDSTILPLSVLKVAIPYLYQYSGFMMFSIHDVMFHALLEYSAVAEKECDELIELLDLVRQQNPAEYEAFLNYFATKDVIEQSLTYLDGNLNKYTNLFYAKFIFKNYQLPDGLRSNLDVIRLVTCIFENIDATNEKCGIVIELLRCSQNNIRIMTDILVVFLKSFSDTDICAFGSDFGKWMDELSDNISEELQTAMASDEHISQFVVYLNSMYIHEVKEPERAFWSLYRNQFSDTYDVDISLMIAALLKRTESAASAVKVLEVIPEKNIGSEKAISILVNLIAALSVKDLFKIKLMVLTKIITLAKNHSLRNHIKSVIAVYFAKRLEADNRNEIRQNSFASTIDALQVQLGSFEKKDYQEYVSECTLLFIESIDDLEDVRALFKMCYHERYYDSFSDELAGILKKLDKKQERKWTQIVALICIYLIDFETRDREASGFIRLFFRYLKKYELDELRTIQSEVLRNCRNPDTDFFERIYKKEGLGDRLGGLFGKNRF